jgi:hypothetical protein
MKKWNKLQTALTLALALGTPAARAGNLNIQGHVTVASNLTAQALMLGNINTTPGQGSQPFTVLSVDGSTNLLVNSWMDWTGVYCWRTIQLNGSFGALNAVEGGAYVGTTGLNIPDGPTVDPGDVWIAGGPAAYAGGYPGNVNISAGAGYDSMYGGWISIRAGDAAGSGDGGDGGQLLLQAGNGYCNYAESPHRGGSLVLRSGAAWGVEGVRGGDVIVETNPDPPRNGDLLIRNFEMIRLGANSNVTLSATNSITLNTSNLTVNALAVYLVGLPASTNGLTSGRLWSDNGTLKVMP